MTQSRSALLHRFCNLLRGIGFQPVGNTNEIHRLEAYATSDNGHRLEAYATEAYATVKTLLLFALLTPVLLAGPVVRAEDPVSFEKGVLPILQANCLGCHQPAKAQGGYVMTDFAKLLAGGESGSKGVVPGDSKGSHLLTEITPKDGKAEMPKGKPPLSDADVQLISRWIQEGAKDDRSTSSQPTFTQENPPTYARPPVITGIDISADGTMLALTGFHEILLFNTSTWQRSARLVGMSPRLESVRFAPEGNLLASTGGRPGISGEVQVWDAATGKLVLSSIVGYDNLFGCSWSPDAKLIAFGATDKVVRAIDASTGERKLFQGAHEDWPRATVFSVSGEHLLSAGRDMTVKLTEVATERFIDNVTSITPGALRGGISSLARHPLRDEILVGGSDGSPKLYRVFRQTARQIGDDANLIRKLPDMPGRIFSVAISPDGKLLAAASTLDGQSQIRVWKYDIEGKLPDDIKAIQGKRTAARTAEEKKKIEAYSTAEPEAVATWEVPEAAIYSIALDRHGRLVAGGSDGKVRVWDCAENKSIVVFDATPTQDANKKEASPLVVERDRYLSKAVQQPMRDLGETKKVDLSKLVKIEVMPEAIELQRWTDYTQLIVRGFDAAGVEYDVTRQASLVDEANRVWVNANACVEPRSVGDGKLKIVVGSLHQELPIKVHQTEISSVDFVQDVNPVLSRLGCNAGTCHGSQAGKNGFKLSLRGYDPLYDVRAFTDDLAGRRVNLSAAHESLMISKPLGLVPHEGGKVMSLGDRSASIIGQWIRDGAKLNLESTRPSKIEIFPINPITQEPGTTRQMRVVATYANGTKRDVTKEAFIETGNGEVATVSEGGVVFGVRRGEAPLLARYDGAYAATTLTIMGNRNDYQWQATPTWNKIDELVASKWQRVKVAPSALCNDAEFLRRVYLDLVGLPPSAEQVRAFLFDPRDSRSKRDAIIDQLLSSEEYVIHWTNKWSDLLQVNSKFLGKEGAQSFKDWIRSQVAANTPYDKFVNSILTATGSNKSNPAASYFKILRTPEETLENSTHLFLAVRFNCNKCHDHPFERWTQDQYYQTAAYFAQVGLKKDDSSGDKTIGGTAVEGAKPLYEEIFDKDSGDVMHQRTSKVAPPTFPFECNYEKPEKGTRRNEFAAWVTSKTNPYFAKSYVNRMWGYMLGTGLIEPLDDIRAGNPASNPELLSFLESEFVKSDFDVKQLIKLICKSRTYQLSVESTPLNADDDRNYSHAKARRLPAEVLYDAVHRVTGTRSKLPGLEEGARAASLADADAGLKDGFLNNLGRPVRESACECERSSDLQLGSVMALVSGPTVGSAIAEPQNDMHQLASSFPDNKQLISEIFYRVLNRPATEKEIDIANKIFERIREDHTLLADQLKKREEWWIGERERREIERIKNLTETQLAAEEREAEIKPERDRLEKERLARIQEAESKRDAYKGEFPQKLAQYLEKNRSNVDWQPILAKKAVSTNKATFAVQPDRSLRVDGKKDKGTYTISAETSMKEITGVRLEALPVPEIPGGGPGIGANGNFVVTELELFAGPLDKPKEMKQVKFKTGVTDFDQGGFSAAALIDGKNKDQGGWAISGATGVEHWAVLRLEKPFTLEAGWGLEFRIHQYHNAEEHRLAHFRLSITSQSGEHPLGLSESLAALERTEAGSRAKPSLDAALNYFAKVDKGIRDLEGAVAVASVAIPEDQTLSQLKKRVDKLKLPTPDEATLVRLRNDMKQSEGQLTNLRLTASEDLTWALINSPAFLFNH